MNSDDSYKLLWHDQLVVTITEVGCLDHPWFVGKFIATDIAPRFREILEWIDLESKSDDGLSTDPPFDAELLHNWYIEKQDGTKTEIMIPVVDFSAGTIEWR